ncbi:hypothetical protein DAPPUDRAFT_326876 [Daphnia pulex]|uniref:Uncharacterized protein n=1 Tax=Daphnia pulex TaxID=6669 RepID=E9H918_DAPPU|nr:hypothetical protein DAPPUDRAFT_326876 [Daphnia pulex]|eukprot:EFX71772.1 hypothetical protein DAPPUDRAFT_326876 [Daphnia pulex]
MSKIEYHPFMCNKCGEEHPYCTEVCPNDNNAESSEEDNSDEEINYDCPSDDECHEYHQQESDDEYFGDYEHKEDEDIDYCDEDDSADLEELEIPFAGSTIDDQKMDQDLANIIAKEEELNFVEVDEGRKVKRFLSKFLIEKRQISKESLVFF